MYNVCFFILKGTLPGDMLIKKHIFESVNKLIINLFITKYEFNHILKQGIMEF
jgi:hypothetical protein